MHNKYSASKFCVDREKEKQSGRAEAAATTTLAIGSVPFAMPAPKARA